MTVQRSSSTPVEGETTTEAVATVPAQRRDAYSVYAEIYALRLETPAPV